MCFYFGCTRVLVTGGFNNLSVSVIDHGRGFDVDGDYAGMGLTNLKQRATDHIHVLNDDQVIIDGVRFLGSVLWTDFALFGETDKFFAMQQARQQMTDFSIIRINGRRFTPEDAIRLHMSSRNWLAVMLAEPFDGNTVMITHHAPSSRSVHPRYARDLLTPAFASDVENLMGGDRAGLWIHGHMHESYDYQIRGTRVVCNPRGYAPNALNPGFRPDRYYSGSGAPVSRSFASL